jgi:hypothetical protein
MAERQTFAGYSPWIQTASGAAFDLLYPLPEAVNPRDLAAALAKQCRFGGHCVTHYSVAQHSIHVASMLPPRLALAGLLHDGHEGYTGDIPAPVKFALDRLGAGEGLAELVDGLDAAIFARFGLAWPLPPDDAELVARADLRALATERRDLLGHELDWGKLPPPAPERILPMPWAKAEDAYFATLTKALDIREAWRPRTGRTRK